MPHVNKGDIVIVHDGALPRGHRKLEKILQVYVGKDGLPQSALVKLPTWDQQHTLLKGPLQLLYPLEVHHDESLPEHQMVPELETVPGAVQEPETEKPQVVSEPETVPRATPKPETKKQPTRATAKRARAIWIQKLKEDSLSNCNSLLLHLLYLDNTCTLIVFCEPSIRPCLVKGGGCWRLYTHDLFYAHFYERKRCSCFKVNLLESECQLVLARSIV